MNVCLWSQGNNGYFDLGHVIGKKMSILPSGEVIYEEEEEKEEHVHEVVGRTGRIFGGLINDVKRRYWIHNLSFFLCVVYFYLPCFN